MILNLYRHRGYIWRTAWSETRTRYAGAGLGIVWNFLQPLAMIAVFWMVFENVMPQHGLKAANGTEIHYLVYLCSALLPWNAFAECVNRGTHSFVSNAVYLRKMPIPEQVFVAQSALGALINLGISFGILLVVALVVGHQPSWHWLLLPIPVAMLMALGFGFGLGLGTVNAFIRDVGQIVPIVLNVGFWLYPIAYPETVLPAVVRDLLPFNPVHPFLACIRDLFVWHRMPEASTWLLMLAWTAGVGGVGYVILRRLRRELRDVI